MSSTKVIINDGEAIVTVDQQRTADTAAAADDRVLDVLLTPEFQGTSTYDKKVHPLLHEPPDSSYGQGRALVYPGPTSGTVRILPAAYVVGGLGNSTYDASTVSFSARGAATDLPASAFPSSSGSDGRFDTVYALVQRTATTDTRKIRDSATGQTSSQLVNIYSTPTVTIAVQPGPEDGSFAAAPLPADSSTAWYFPLAYIVLDDGLGGPWTQGTAIGQSRISQGYDAGWIKRNRIQFAKSASIMSTVFSEPANGCAATPLSDRWGGTISVVGVLQNKSTTGSELVFDDNFDWRRRVLTIKAGRVIDSGAGLPARPDDLIQSPTEFDATTTQFLFTPAEVATSTHVTIATWDVNEDGTEIVTFKVNDAGALEVMFTDTGGMPADGVSYYYVQAEATDNFLL
jgi:hypothetical protein